MLTEMEQQEFQVIARKWRPKTFDDVVGQDHIVRTLQNAITLNRIAHGYLFTGSRGVGKTSTARIFARALNCEQGPTAKPCGVCQMCIEIVQGNNMDVIEIDGASNRGVEEIRNLRESVKFVPASGKYKVYIIDEVHMLTKEAFNALLKTLEEPPSHVVFIFATTEPHRVPQTILSRCQRFDFHRINHYSIARQLALIADSENIQVDKKVVDALAKAGDGSMRDAQSMFDQVISFCGTNVTFEQVSQILGVYDKGFFFDFVTYAHERKIAQGLSVLDTIIREGKDVNHFFEGLLNHYRYLLLVTLLEDKTDMLDCTEDELAEYRAQAKLYNRYELEFAVEMISEAALKLRYALSKQVVLELLFIRLSRLKSVISIDQALLKLSHIQQELATQPVHRSVCADTVSDRPQAESKPVHAVSVSSETKNTVERPDVSTAYPKPDNIQHSQRPSTMDAVDDSIQRPAPKPVSIEQIKRVWPQLPGYCKNALLKSFLDRIEPLEYADSILKIGAGDPYVSGLIKDRASDLENIIEQALNVRVKVALVVNKTEKKHNSTDESIQRQSASPRNDSSHATEDKILNNPDVQLIIDKLDAKVLSLRKDI